jgi:heme O synthase-like polyprenyltransferase
MSRAARRSDHRESNRILATGAGIGALGAITAIVGTAACPVCVVAAPAFLGVGLYRRWKERSTTAATPAGSPDQ